MNSRIREPLIWPPNRNETSKETSSDLSAGALGGMDVADRPADALRGLEHGRRVHQGLELAGVGVLEALGQGRQHRLADRQIAGAGDRHDALAGLGEDMQLAEGRDVVEAGIGAGIRDHDETVPHQNSATIGHSRSPNAPEFVGGQTSSQFQGGIQPQFPWRGMPGRVEIGPRGRGRQMQKSTPDRLRGHGAGGCVLAASSKRCAGPWEDGMAAYNRGDYVPAIRLFRPLAEKGNPKAQSVRSG